MTRSIINIDQSGVVGQDGATGATGSQGVQGDT